jgi:ABC-2 type transport system permease protein
MLKKAWIMARTEIRMVFKSRQVKSIPVMVVLFSVIFSAFMAWLIIAIPAPPDPFFYRLMMASTMGLVIVMMPVLLPVMIAADSIVGEKERHTLVPLLATPLTDSELLLGKCLTAIVPGLVVAYVNFILAIGIMNGMLLFMAPFLLWVWPTLLDIVQALIMPPLFSALAVGFTVIISGRVSTVYEAYQLSTLIVLPAMIIPYIGLLQGSGFDWLILILVAVILGIADYAVFRLSLNLFSRDRLISRL